MFKELKEEPGVVACTCSSSNVESISRKIMVQSQPQASYPLLHKAVTIHFY
jgi:hypothetical protein